MKLKTFLAEVRRYWKTFLGVTGAVFILAAAWLLMTPAAYVSTTQLLVSISGTTTAAAYQNDDVVTGRVNSYIALLTSDVVSQRVIDKLGLSMTAPELASQVSATRVPPNTSIIDVSVTADSPDRAKLLADTVGSEFIDYASAIETPTGEDSQKVHVTTVTPASQPRTDLAQRGVLGVLVAGFAVLLGLVGVWVRARFDPVVRAADRGALVSGFPVLGCVDVSETDTATELAEYRRLRNAVQSASGDRDISVLQIVPTDDDVDTRNIAVNLGRVIALNGHRCVVLDATSAAQSDESAEPDGSAESDTNPTDGPTVDEIALTPAAFQSDFDGAHGAAQQIADLQAHYDCVLVAATPVSEHSNTSILSDYADAVLVAAATDTSKRSDLRRTGAAVIAAGKEVTGLILVHQAAAPTDESHESEEASDDESVDKTEVPATAVPSELSSDGEATMGSVSGSI